MQNNTEERKAEQLRLLLQGSSDETIGGILEQLREQGELYAVEPVIELLFAKRDEEVKRKVASLLADLTDQRAVVIIAQSISHFRGETALSQLVSACWQSRLNFTDYAELFVDLLRHEPMLTGVEAYSVLEMLLPQLPQERQTACVKALRQGPATDAAKDSAALIEALLEELNY